MVNISAMYRSKPPCFSFYLSLLKFVYVLRSGGNLLVSTDILVKTVVIAFYFSFYFSNLSFSSFVLTYCLFLPGIM